ncbi:SDR family oxidoreductase [Brevundimonas sp.]|uniref:SDR family NAD(P)-dependent oxidoreductase n=1 Tax=Brevundimonas sp. TaxID=1871086 RepID=UPI001A218317|nr:SDR family oxidoreductase [Brevundimonas sp.]MBJ7484683.1 SDR family oxidoreductase [Brevundimonas sp.]
MVEAVLNLFDLTGRTALITGATGGIGEATARLFASVGATLVLSSNEGDRLAALVSEFCHEGIDAHALETDLSDLDAVRAMARQAVSVTGQIDILISNAGMEGHVGPLHEASDAAIDRLLAVNLKSGMALCAELAPGMARAGKGSIVLVASIAGVRGNKSIGLYGLSKAALAQLARNLAVEWGPLGVRVNTMSPGLVRTPFAQPILDNPDYFERRMSLTPLRRPGEVDEIAAGILYLASDASGFVTGHNLIADGGTTISDGN